MSDFEPQSKEEDRAARERLAGSPLLEILAYVLLVLVAFWPVVSGAQTFFGFDLRYQYLPNWHAIQEALLSGEGLTWVPGTTCGMPQLFAQDAPIFHPLTLLLLRTGGDVHRLSDLFSLVHFWLAGFAMHRLLVDQKVGAAAAAFGGIGWMLSARLLQSAIWPNAVATLALAPILIQGLLRIGDGRRASGITLSALSGGAILLCARPQAILGLAPLFVSIGVLVLVRSRARRNTFADLFVATLLAVSLGAPFWLPAFRLYPETPRWGGLSPQERDVGSISPSEDLDQLFLPVDGRARWPEAAAWPGLAVSLGVLLGLGFVIRRRESIDRPLFWTLAIGGGAGLAFSFGAAGPWRFFADLPVIDGFRVPARFLASWSLALPLLSALAIDQFRNGWLARWPAVRFAPAALLALELVVHARLAAPVGSPRLVDAEPRIVEELRSSLGVDPLGFPRRAWTVSAIPVDVAGLPDDSLDRLFEDREPLAGAFGLRFGLSSAGGYGVPMRRIEELFQKRITERAALLGGVTAIVALEESDRTPMPVIGRRAPRIYRLPEPLPRAVVVPRAIVVSEADALAKIFDPSFDPSRIAVVEGGEEIDAREAWGDRSASIRRIDHGPGRFELAVDMPDDGLLVLHETFVPGWRCEVDGESTPVVRAQYAFLGMRLSKGTHQVRVTYEAEGLGEAFLLAALGIVGTVVMTRRWRSESGAAAATRGSGGDGETAGSSPG